MISKLIGLDKSSKELSLEEILEKFASSEEFYIHQILNKLVEFQRHSKENNVVSDEEANLIFRNINEIYEVHLQFFEHLCKDFAQAMKKCVPFFKLYGFYLCNHEQALAAFNSKKLKSRGFAQIVESMYAFGCDVVELMQVPIHRIEQYAEYASEMIKLIEREHIDDQGLVETLKDLRKISNVIFEKELDRLARIDVYNIQVNVFLDKINVTLPSRFVVKKDTLKISYNGRKFIDVAVVLFNDFVLLANLSFDVKLIFRTCQVACSQSENRVGVENAFCVKHEAGSTYFAAKSIEERNDWIFNIEQVSKIESKKQKNSVTYDYFCKLIMKKATEDEINEQEDMTKSRVFSWIGDKDNVNENNDTNIDCNADSDLRRSFNVPLTFPVQKSVNFSEISKKNNLDMTLDSIPIPALPMRSPPKNFARNAHTLPRKIKAKERKASFSYADVVRNVNDPQEGISEKLSQVIAQNPEFKSLPKKPTASPYTAKKFAPPPKRASLDMNVFDEKDDYPTKVEFELPKPRKPIPQVNPKRNTQRNLADILKEDKRFQTRQAEKTLDKNEQSKNNLVDPKQKEKFVDVLKLVEEKQSNALKSSKIDLNHVLPQVPVKKKEDLHLPVSSISKPALKPISQEINKRMEQKSGLSSPKKNVPEMKSDLQNVDFQSKPNSLALKRQIFESALQPENTDSSKFKPKAINASGKVQIQTKELAKPNQNSSVPLKTLGAPPAQKKFAEVASSVHKSNHEFSKVQHLK
jgi:hypothetical protein